MKKLEDKWITKENPYWKDKSDNSQIDSNLKEATLKLKSEDFEKQLMENIEKERILDQKSILLTQEFKNFHSKQETKQNLKEEYLTLIIDLIQLDNNSKD